MLIAGSVMEHEWGRIARTFTLLLTDLSYATREYTILHCVQVLYQR